MSRSKEKKICFITVAHPQYGIGGAELQTYYYSKEFSKQGWDVTFFTFTRNKVLHPFNNSGIKVVNCKRSPLFFITWLRSFIMLLRIDSNIYFVRHHNFLLGVAGFICKVKNKILVWSTMHDESCGENPNIDPKIKKISLSRAKMLFENMIYRYGVRNSNMILSQNKIQKQIIRDVHGKESLIIYNSHPTVMKLIAEQEKKLIFVATMKDFKQPEIFCGIARENEFRKYQFVIIGRNYSEPQKAKKLLEIMTGSGCVYLGPLSPEEVNEQISTSKILINTSISEGFPNTFVQAWSLGIPVISLNVDPDNIIKENQLGFVCNGNRETCRQKISLLLKNQETWNQISRNCLSFAHTKLDLKKNVELLSNKFLDMVHI